MGNVEVDKEADGAPTEFEVGQKLGLMKGKQLGNRLEFHDHKVFHKQIHPVATINAQVAVEDG